MGTRRYPHCPKSVDVFWENGRYVAIVRDSRGTRRNVAMPNATTKRAAILDAREYLDMDNSAYTD